MALTLASFPAAAPPPPSRRPLRRPLQPLCPPCPPEVLHLPSVLPAFFQRCPVLPAGPLTGLVQMRPPACGCQGPGTCTAASAGLRLNCWACGVLPVPPGWAPVRSERSPVFLLQFLLGLQVCAVSFGKFLAVLSSWLLLLGPQRCGTARPGAAPGSWALCPVSSPSFFPLHPARMVSADQFMLTDWSSAGLGLPSGPSQQLLADG